MTRTRATIAVLLMLLGAGAGLELCYGAKTIRAGRVASILTGRLPASAPDAELDRMIVLDVRVPRLLLAIAVGGALAIGGAVMQAVFQNPMADPYLLGVANGGAFGAVLALNIPALGASFLALPAAALAGGLLAAAAVYLVAMTIGRLSPLTLILGGLAVGFLLSSGTMLVLVLSDHWNLQEGLFWLMGSVKNRTWEHVWIAGPAVLAGAALLMAFCRELDILMMGDHAAASLGVSVGRMRFVLLALAAVITAVSVAVAGVVGFVGLMAPHLMRLIVGPQSRRLLPASFVGGAVFVVFADLLAQWVTRAWDLRVELQLGIISSLIGVPVLLFLLRRHAQRVQ